MADIGARVWKEVVALVLSQKTPALGGVMSFFGRTAGLALQQLPMRWLVERCRCKLRVDGKLSRKEPSAGYRRWWSH